MNHKARIRVCLARLSPQFAVYEQWMLKERCAAVDQWDHNETNSGNKSFNIACIAIAYRERIYLKHKRPQPIYTYMYVCYMTNHSTRRQFTCTSSDIIAASSRAHFIQVDWMDYIFMFLFLFFARQVANHSRFLLIYSRIHENWKKNCIHINIIFFYSIHISFA